MIICGSLYIQLQRAVFVSLLQSNRLFTSSYQMTDCRSAPNESLMQDN